MLQKDLPSARIMTFNYDSVWFGEKPTRLTIDGVATNLLDQLQMERSVGPISPHLQVLPLTVLDRTALTVPSSSLLTALEAWSSSAHLPWPRRGNTTTSA